jgi:hypothetical protein
VNTIDTCAMNIGFYIMVIWFGDDSGSYFYSRQSLLVIFWIKNRLDSFNGDTIIVVLTCWINATGLILSDDLRESFI